MLNQLIINGIVAAAIYALVGVSVATLLTTSRFFVFSNAAVITFGAYLAFTAKSLFAVSPMQAIPIVLLGTAVLGGLIDLLVYRPLSRRGATSEGLLLASLGVFVVLHNVVVLIWGDNARYLGDTGPANRISFVGGLATPAQLSIVGCCVAALVLYWLLLHHTRFGVLMRATGTDRQLAVLHGASVDRIVCASTCIGSALGGLAGYLVAVDVDVTPNLGLRLFMMGMVTVVVGGGQKIRAIVAGALLLGLAQHVGVWKIGSQWQDAVAFAVMLLALVCGRRAFLVRD